MKKHAFTLLTSLLVAALATASFGQSSTRTTIAVSPHIENSAADQLRYCYSLAPTVYNATTDADRLRALATATVNINLIPRLWPDERETILRARLLEADLALYAHAPKNAIETMNAALPLAGATEYAALAHRRLGAAYEQTGDRSTAEAEYRASEQNPAFAKLSQAEAEKTLRDVAGFFSRAQKHAEAAQRYRALADLRKDAPLLRACFFLASAKESANIPEPGHASAKNDLASFDRAASDAQAAIKKAEENTLLQSYKHDADRIRTTIAH